MSLGFPADTYDIPQLDIMYFNKMGRKELDDLDEVIPFIEAAGYKVLGYFDSHIRKWDVTGIQMFPTTVWNQWVDYRNVRDMIYNEFCLRVFDYPLDTTWQLHQFLKMCRELPTIRAGEMPSSHCIRAICLAIARYYPLTYKNFPGVKNEVEEDRRCFIINVDIDDPYAAIAKDQGRGFDFINNIDRNSIQCDLPQEQIEKYIPVNCENRYDDKSGYHIIAEYVFTNKDFLQTLGERYGLERISKPPALIKAPAPLGRSIPKELRREIGRYLYGRRLRRRSRRSKRVIRKGL